MVKEMWLIGVHAVKEGTAKSYKVRLELPPKGWAHIPVKKTSVVVKLEDKPIEGFTDHYWARFLVSIDWVEDLAKVGKYAYVNEVSCLKAWSDRSAAILKWDGSGDPGVKKTLPLYMPSYRGDAEF